MTEKDPGNDGDDPSLLRSLLEDVTPPEGYDPELADRNGRLVELVESSNPTDWETALEILLRDLGIAATSRDVDKASFSAVNDTYVADCFRVAQVAMKLQKETEKERPPRYGRIVFLARMRKRAQRFSREYSGEPETLHHPGLAINGPTDPDIAEFIKNTKARITWIREKVDPKRSTKGKTTTPHTLRLELAKASLENMGVQLEEIAQKWAETSGKDVEECDVEECDVEECIEYCFSYFTNEVLKRFPETGWINIPAEVDAYPDYEVRGMHRFVELGEDHLKSRLGKRAERVIHGKQAPDSVHKAIHELINKNEEFLEM